MASEVTWRGLSLTWVIWNNMSQSNCCSSMSNIGVPKGSVLGPVLHLYMNDMYWSSNQIRFVHFADDITVFSIRQWHTNVHATVNGGLVEVNNWREVNRLSLNVRKNSCDNPKLERFMWQHFNSLFNPYENFNSQIPRCYPRWKSYF